MVRNSDQQQRHQSHLDSWSQLPNGANLKSLIEHELAPWWPKVFGHHLLSLGALSAQLSMPGLPAGRRFSLYEGKQANIVANFHELAVANEIIDTLVMNMVLDFDDDPYQVLREADRVLIDGGYLFIVGFNPLSPASIGKLIPKYQLRPPWSGRFYMPARVRDWLGLLGYQVLADQRILYHHMLTTIPRNSIWQQTLKAWLPRAGSIYVIVARKLTSPLTPIGRTVPIKQRGWRTAPTAGRVRTRY